MVLDFLACQIVCKYFIQAIETEKYGWFWECPNGESCHYRHALPPGFVLKSQKKAIEDAEKANAISLEEFLEVEVWSSSVSPAYCGELTSHIPTAHSAINSVLT